MKNLNTIKQDPTSIIGISNMSRLIKINKVVTRCSECDYFVDSLNIDSEEGHFCNHCFEFMGSFSEQDSTVWNGCELKKHK